MGSLEQVVRRAGFRTTSQVKRIEEMNCFNCLQTDSLKKLKDTQGCLQFKNIYEARANGEIVEGIKVAPQEFTFRELATATRNFKQEFLLGEGAFGRVFRGVLTSTGQVVAIKQLDRSGIQGSNKEFLDEVGPIGLLDNPNLINLIGYCADGDQRLLVFEFMSGGSLERHLFNVTPEKSPLDWSTRMKIAFGAAKGLEYLHCAVNPPVKYQNLKPSNILLDEEFNPKLIDFGLSWLGSSGGDNTLFGPSRAIGTYGYCAPECVSGGDPTLESDIYTFGVVLLQLITGRRVVDITRSINEQNLVAWAQPIFGKRKRFPELVDPLLQKQFPEKGLNQAVAVAAMCLQEEPSARPLISDVVTTLCFLWMAPDEELIDHDPSKTTGGDDDDNSGYEDESSEDEEQKTIPSESEKLLESGKMKSCKSCKEIAPLPDSSSSSSKGPTQQTKSSKQMTRTISCTPHSINYDFQTTGGGKADVEDDCSSTFSLNSTSFKASDVAK